MADGLDYLNLGLQEKSLAIRNDFSGGGAYDRRMGTPRHDWFLKEWLAASNKKQADVVHELDWNKAKVSLMVRGLQAYTRKEINELAEYLNIRPYELLMHPDDAYRLRRLREDAIRLAHDQEDDPEPLKKVSAH